MRNAKISLPEDVYRRARVAAAECDTSLSAWIRDLLIGTMDSRSDFERRKRLQDEVTASIESFDASDRLSRDELHRR